MTDTGLIALHATAIVIGEAGILIRGASGAGKSHLALLLLKEATRQGRFARLVGDDRVLVRVNGVAVIASPHPAIVGFVERRTQPFWPMLHEPRCLVRLVVDLQQRDTPLPRVPEEHTGTTRVATSGPLPVVRLQTPLDALSCDDVLEALGTVVRPVEEP